MLAISFKSYDEWHSGVQLNIVQDVKGVIVSNLHHTDWMHEDRKPINIEIPESIVNSIFSVISNTSVSLIPESSDGLGGISYELTVAVSTKQSVCFRWWCELPPSWEALNKVITQLEDIISIHYAQLDAVQ